MTDYQKIFIVNKPISEVYTAITEHIADNHCHFERKRRMY